MKKKAQVYLLDTKQKDGTIWITGENQLIHTHVSSRYKEVYQPKHLYFTSDEATRSGDYVYDFADNKVRLFEEIGVGRKVVATTNPELHKPSMIRRADGCPFYLQSNGLYQATDEHGTETLEVSNVNSINIIGKDFVEAYIKAYNTGKPITEVNLEYELDILTEPDTHDGNPCSKFVGTQQILKLRSNGTVIISPLIEKFYSRDEVLDILMCFDTDSNVGHFNGPTTRIAWFDKNYPK